MNIVTITLQKRIRMGALKTAQFTLIFVGNGTHALWPRARGHYTSSKFVAQA